MRVQERRCSLQMLSALGTEVNDTNVEIGRLQASLKNKTIKLRHLKCKAGVLANYKPLIDLTGDHHFAKRLFAFCVVPNV